MSTPVKPEAPTPTPETPPTPPVTPTSEARVSDADLGDAWDQALRESGEAPPAATSTAPVTATAPVVPPVTPPATSTPPAEAPVVPAVATPSGTTPEEIDDLDLDPRTPEGRKNRSNLGRQVAELKEMVVKLTERPAPAPQPPATPVVPASVAAEEEGEIPEEFSDLSDPLVMDRYLNWRSDQLNSRTKKYEDSYVQAVWGFKPATGADHDGIVDLMAEKFNKRRGTGNPVLDAQLNYNESAAAYYRIKLARPAASVSPTPPAQPVTPVPPPRYATAPPGVTVPHSNVAPGGEAPVLDEFAAEFVRKTGMKADSVKDALSRPLDAHLAGRAAR